MRPDFQLDLHGFRHVFFHVFRRSRAGSAGRPDNVIRAVKLEVGIILECDKELGAWLSVVFVYLNNDTVDGLAEYFLHCIFHSALLGVRAVLLARTSFVASVAS